MVPVAQKYLIGPPRTGPKIRCIGARASWGNQLNITTEVIAILDDVLSLHGSGAAFTPETPLLGAIAALDSMAVVALITTLEDRFGWTIHDDEIDGSTFATLGSLVDFVSQKNAL